MENHRGNIFDAVKEITGHHPFLSRTLKLEDFPPDRSLTADPNCFLEIRKREPTGRVVASETLRAE
jgi:hypothetical protein